MNLSTQKMIPPPVFQLSNVTKTYQMGEVNVDALRGINVELYCGELAVLI